MKEELIFAFSAVEYQYEPPSKEHPDYYARLADAAIEVMSKMQREKEPEKQTLEDFCVQNTPQGNLDLLIPSEVICLISEWHRTVNN